MMPISVSHVLHRDPPTTRAERLTCSSSNLTCCPLKLSCKLQCCHCGVTSCSLAVDLFFSQKHWLLFYLFVCLFSWYFFLSNCTADCCKFCVAYPCSFIIDVSCMYCLLHSFRDSGCCWLSNVEGKTNWTSHAHLNLCSRSDSMSLNNCPVTATVSSLR